MTNYLMNYIGVGLYGMKRFINESKRVGVQRVVPFNNLHKITWSQPILCGEFQKNTEKVLVSKWGNLELHGDIITKITTIFGFFRASNLSYSGLPDDLKAKIVSKMDIVSFVDYPQPQQEERSCGQYSIGGYCTVRDSIEDITKHITEACEELGYKPNDYKYFLKGDLETFDNPIIIYNKKFSRGYSWIDIPNAIHYEKPEQAMFFLYDYDKRAYLRKDDRSNLDNMLVDEYIQTHPSHKVKKK